MLKRFFKDSAIYSMSTILSRGIAIFLVPFYTRVLSPNDYGIIDIITIIATLASYIVSLEVSQGVAIYFTGAKTKQEKIEYASTALWFTIIMFSLCLIISLFFSKELSYLILDSKRLQRVMILSLFTMWANGIYNLLQCQLRWQLQPVRNSISSIAYLIASVFIAVLLVLIFKQGVIGVFWGQLSGCILGSILAFYFARDSYKTTIVLSRLKEMLSFSIPLVPSSISVLIALYIDRIVIKKLMSLYDVGLYGIGYRFASLLGLIITGFQLSTMPLIYSNYKNNNMPFEIARIFRYFLSIVIPLIIFLALFSEELLIVFTTPDYYPAYSVIPLLALGLTFSHMYIFAPGLAIHKKTKHIAIINIIVAAENIILNFLLISFYGVIGAALGTMISGLTSFLLYMYFSQKLYTVPHNWKSILSVVFIGCCIFILNNIIDPKMITRIILKVILLLITCVFTLFILIGLRDMKEIAINTSVYLKKKLNII